MLSSQRYWRYISRKSEGFSLDDEVFFITYFSSIKMRFFWVSDSIFPFIDHFLFHSSHWILRMRSFYDILSISPVWGEGSSNSLIEIARQLSTWIHIKGITVTIDMCSFCWFFDCFWTEISRWFIFLSFRVEEISFLFFLFFVMSSTIHSCSLIVIILK